MSLAHSTSKSRLLLKMANLVLLIWRSDPDPKVVDLRLKSLSRKTKKTLAKKGQLLNLSSAKNVRHDSQNLNLYTEKGCGVGVQGPK